MRTRLLKVAVLSCLPLTWAGSATADTVLKGVSPMVDV